jgi:hypothetical protein
MGRGEHPGKTIIIQIKLNRYGFAADEFLIQKKQGQKFLSKAIHLSPHQDRWMRCHPAKYYRLVK